MEEYSPENTIERELISRASHMQRPVTGSLELLPLCNLSCSMCYVRLSREEMEKEGQLHKASEWLRLAEEMQKAGVFSLQLTGGEPLLFPGFQELYKGLQAMGMILTVNTNGTLIDEKWADFFAENPPPPHQHHPLWQQ